MGGMESLAREEPGTPGKLARMCSYFHECVIKEVCEQGVGTSVVSPFQSLAENGKKRSLQLLTLHDAVLMHLTS